MGWIPEIWQSLKGRPTLSLLRFNWSSFSICWKSTPEDFVVLLLRAWLMFYSSPRTVTLTACITFLFSHTETLVLLLRDCTPWPTEEVSQKYVRRADPNVTNQRQIPITTRVKLKLGQWHQRLILVLLTLSSAESSLFLLSGDHLARH